MKEIRGITLLELILSIAISAIVLLMVYTGFNLSIKVTKRVEARLDNQAREILFQLSKDLRSAYLSDEKDSFLKFFATPTSLNFVTVARLGKRFIRDKEYDLREVSYELEPRRESELNALVYRVDLTPDKEVTSGGEKEELSALIKSLRFSYYDGVSWRQVWNSQTQLPKAVRVFLELVSKNDPAISRKLSTIVIIR